MNITILSWPLKYINTINLVNASLVLTQNICVIIENENYLNELGGNTLAPDLKQGQALIKSKFIPIEKNGF